MIPFAFGVSIVFAGLMGALLGLDPTVRWFERPDIAMLIARSVVGPVIAAWLVAEGVNLVRPLRLFDPRIARWVPRVLVGVASGLIGTAAASLLLAFAVGVVHDVVILAGSAGLGTMMTLIVMPRVRPGACIYCGYDVRSQPGPGMPGWGTCPECGASIIPGRSNACAAA